MADSAWCRHRRCARRAWHMPSYNVMQRYMTTYHAGAWRCVRFVADFWRYMAVAWRYLALYGVMWCFLYIFLTALHGAFFTVFCEHITV